MRVLTQVSETRPGAPWNLFAFRFRRSAPLLRISAQHQHRHCLTGYIDCQHLLLRCILRGSPIWPTG